MEEIVQLNIEDAIESAVKKNGFDGTLVDGFSKKSQQIVGQVVVNGQAHNQTKTIEIKIEYIGEGTISDDKKEVTIYGIRVVAENTENEFWEPYPDIIETVKKIS